MKTFLSLCLSPQIPVPFPLLHSKATLETFMHFELYDC
jgi:hypothetical protein